MQRLHEWADGQARLTQHANTLSIFNAQLCATLCYRCAAGNFCEAFVHQESFTWTLWHMILLKTPSTYVYELWTTKTTAG